MPLILIAVHRFPACIHQARPVHVQSLPNFAEAFFRSFPLEPVPPHLIPGLAGALAFTHPRLGTEPTMAFDRDQEVANVLLPFRTVQSLQALTFSSLTHESRLKLRLRHAPCLESVRGGARLCAPSLLFVGPALSVKGRQKQKRPQLKGIDMPTLTCSQMKSAIERILRSHGMLEEFLQNPEFAVRIKNEPFQPLTIERHDSQITVTHYFKQNGDMICDPDMEFKLMDDGSWCPIAIQFATGHYRRAMQGPQQFRDQTSFSTMWAKNLISQRFDSGLAEKIS
jgi:hypothetical protein